MDNINSLGDFLYRHQVTTLFSVIIFLLSVYVSQHNSWQKRIVGAFFVWVVIFAPIFSLLYLWDEHLKTEAQIRIECENEFYETYERGIPSHLQVKPQLKQAYELDCYLKKSKLHYPRD